MTNQTPSAPVYTGLRGVQSETTAGLIYLISADVDDRLRCTCPDFAYRGHLRPCKHLTALAPAAAAPLAHSCGLYCDDERDCLACQQAARS